MRQSRADFEARENYRDQQRCQKRSAKSERQKFRSESGTNEERPQAVKEPQPI